MLQIGKLKFVPLSTDKKLYHGCVQYWRIMEILNKSVIRCDTNNKVQVVQQSVIKLSLYYCPLFRKGDPNYDIGHGPSFTNILEM